MALANSIMATTLRTYHFQTMSSENDILGLADNTTATRNTADIQDWQFVVLREELLEPGVTTSINLTFVVSDLNIPRNFEPATIVHTLVLAPLPPVETIDIWFQVPVFNVTQGMQPRGRATRCIVDSMYLNSRLLSIESYYVMRVCGARQSIRDSLVLTWAA